MLEARQIFLALSLHYCIHEKKKAGRMGDGGCDGGNLMRQTAAQSVGILVAELPGARGGC
jgi:hypothetical protein